MKNPIDPIDPCDPEYSPFDVLALTKTRLGRSSDDIQYFIVHIVRLIVNAIYLVSTATGTWGNRKGLTAPPRAIQDVGPVRILMCWSGLAAKSSTLAWARSVMAILIANAIHENAADIASAMYVHCTHQFMTREEGARRDLQY